MPRPPIDLHRKIKDILQHVQPLPDEANAPIMHYKRTIADIWASLAYAPRILAPTRNDINYLKRFLDETASLCNQRVGDRLAQLLTAIYTPTLASPTPQVMADRVASIFRLPLHVGPAVGVVPPD